MKKLSFLNVVGLDLISLSFYLSFFAFSCFCCPSLKIIVEHVNSTILFGCLFFLVFLVFSFFFQFLEVNLSKCWFQLNLQSKRDPRKKS